MNKTAFIICEYDPFHNGHKYHIDKTREAGAERIVCLMSGNFVQRGDIAFCDKFSRARMAVENGADIVLEIPPKYVLSGASLFASGAAEIVKKCGLSGTLSFGASADTGSLKKAARIIYSDSFQDEIKWYSLETGCSYASSAYKLLDDIDHEAALILTDPNNVLALEYIRAFGDIDLFSVRRESSMHDSFAAHGEFASAKYIREQIYGQMNNELVKKYVPESVYNELSAMMERGEAPSDKQKFSACAMYKLISLEGSDFLEINGVNQGLENRITACIRDSSDIYSLYDSVKTKRFTHSRIRQIIVSAVLGITKAGIAKGLPYIRVLGFNRTGREILKEIRSVSDVKLVMNLSDAPDCPDKELDYRTGKLFDICRPVPFNKNAEFTAKPFVADF